MDLPDPGIELGSPALQEDFLPTELPGSPEIYRHINQCSVVKSLVVKNPATNAEDIRDRVLIPGLGRSPGAEHSNPLQYFSLENPMDRGAWQATVHRVTKSRDMTEAT